MPNCPHSRGEWSEGCLQCVRDERDALKLQNRELETVRDYLSGKVTEKGNALEIAEREISRLRAWEKEVCATMLDRDNKLQESNRLNGELKGRVEMLTASLESILKREYGLDFQTYLKSKEAGPLTRVLLDELIAQLPDNTKKQKCLHPTSRPFGKGGKLACSSCGDFI